MSSGKVKCTCGWSWNKSDSSKKDMYICHECGRDNSNNMKNGGDIPQAQVGNKVKKETEADRAKRVAQEAANATGVGIALDQVPGLETMYDAYNVIDGYRQGDPMKILPNIMGALIPGTAGKAFEAVTNEYLPKTPQKEKDKMKAVLKGKRATPEEIRKTQESVNWSEGWNKLKNDVRSILPRRYENGGWLDNYNDSQASAPEGMVGDGFSNVGRNYSPAWGGQFQDGGNVNNEDYNMKRALELGYTADESGHWPSVDYETGEWLKSKKHHTRGMEMMAYELNPELRNKYNLIENEKGKLQYVPKLQKIEEYQMGGSLPGAVGFTYARTKGIPSEGPYAKKTLPSAQNGQEMQYYREGLDFTPKNISKNGAWLDNYQEGGIIKDDMGQWAYPGEITEIGSNDITMEGVPYDVLGISDTGDTKLMKPGKNYKFKGKKVTEFPMAKNGMRQEQKGLVNLDNLTNFTNYNKPQPGGWLSKYE